jgi:MFS family permease
LRGALEGVMNTYRRGRRLLSRTFRGLWRVPDFRRLWVSLTITSFGAQVTNLALPLTAALMLQATPLQMGILVALETLPFALVSLHAGVLLDRVRKLPVVIACNVSRGVALLLIPLAAYGGWLSVEMLFVVGFFCGVQNVVGGAAYQVLITQMAGRKRLVEANAKITLGETSAALVGPGFAGALIQLLTAPFAILFDAATFLASGLMLRRLQVPNDVPHAAVRAPVMVGDPRGPPARVAQSHAVVARHGGGCLAGTAPHADRRADPVRDARARAFRGCHRRHLHGGRPRLRDRGRVGEKLAARLGVGPVIVLGLGLTACAWQAIRLRGWLAAHATLLARRRDAGVRLRRDALRHHTTCRCARRSRRIA